MKKTMVICLSLLFLSGCLQGKEPEKDKLKISGEKIMNKLEKMGADEPDFDSDYFSFLISNDKDDYSKLDDYLIISFSYFDDTTSGFSIGDGDEYENLYTFDIEHNYSYVSIYDEDDGDCTYAFDGKVRKDKKYPSKPCSGKMYKKAADIYDVYCKHLLKTLGVTREEFVAFGDWALKKYKQ